MIRALLMAAFVVTTSPLVISTQWLLEKLGLRSGFVGSSYFRVLCALLRVRIRINGAPVRDRPVLFISNHASWIDILVIGSILPVAFVAKREVRDWPLVGITAQIQRTIFVDRSRRHQTAAAVGEIVNRLHDGTPVVLFAEGTSSDGNRVLPFRSALLGTVEHAAARDRTNGSVLIQPMSICYTALHGIPMGRQHRPLVAWYGDFEFVPHLKAFVARAAVDAVVSYGEPVTVEPGADRKALTRRLEGTVRASAATALLGRPAQAPTSG
jgi:1-acyl-sn-glycerol-3-phosphate acyltransferase